MTTTYRAMSFCSDGPFCASADCFRRFTDADRAAAQKAGLPVAWQSRRETCSTFVAIARERRP